MHSRFFGRCFVRALVLLIGAGLLHSAFAQTLLAPEKREIAMQLVSSAENSSLNWRAQYAYIEDIGDGRGYTGGLIGFTSATGDMLDVVARYTALRPENRLANHPKNLLAKYMPALTKLAADGSSSHEGLDPAFAGDWKKAAADAEFRNAQDQILTEQYLEPAVRQAVADGLSVLGQFMYYDALVMHGPGSGPNDFGGIRAAARRRVMPPAAGGNEQAYLTAFLDARIKVMRTEKAHEDTSRVDLAQRRFLDEGNYDLWPPLRWRTNEEDFVIFSVKPESQP